MYNLHMQIKRFWYLMVCVLASYLCAAPLSAQNANVAQEQLTEADHLKIQEQLRPDIKFGALKPTYDTRVLPPTTEHVETGHADRSLIKENVQFSPSSAPLPGAPKMMAIAPHIRFRAKITAPVDGRIAKVGDIVSAELLDTIMLPGGTMAGAGSPVMGEITDVQRSKKPLKADTSLHRWHDANGLLSMKVTKVCGRDMMVDVIPCPKTRVERGNRKALALGVDSHGDIVFRYSMAGANTANLAISGLGFFAGPVGWIVGPVVGGAAGATEPVLTYGRPITERDTHPRLNGMVKGIAGGLPGGYFISGAINHGLDPALDIGDVVTFEERGSEAL